VRVFIGERAYERTVDMMKSLETLGPGRRSAGVRRIVPGVTSLRRLAAPACASLLLLAACGGSDGDTGTEGAVEGAATSADTVAAGPSEPTGASEPTVPAALQFTAPAVGGGEIDAAAYAGTPTVFWFWAPT
jgi:hypothetical protein